MRFVEHALAGARAAGRRAAARRVGRSPDKVEPARLVVRLDDTDLPGSLGTGDALQLGDWRKLIAGTVEWLGPVDVAVLAVHAGDHPQLAEVIRFAHRLECSTLLVCDGSGVDLARAEELVDRGLQAVRILVGGVSEEVQRAVVGNSVLEATAAVQAMAEARRDRGAALDLEVGVPWQADADRELRAVLGWARQAGADGLRVLAPWHARDMPADPELLDSLAAAERPFFRTSAAALAELHAMVANQDGEPGLPRRSGPARRRRFRCPVGGQRVEVGALGRVSCCPFKAPIGQLDGRLVDTWASAGPHLEAIAACERACAHPELAPLPILPRP